MRQDRGQSMIEFAVVLPLLLVVVLGLIEVSYALYDQHVVTKLTREGSNLISRDTSLQDAATALGTSQRRPVDFTTNSKVIFSVIMNVGATGTQQLRAADSLPALRVRGDLRHQRSVDRRRLVRPGPGLHGDQPGQRHQPSCKQSSGNVTIPVGGMVYVTEIFTRAHAHHAVQPLWRHGAQHALFDRVFLANTSGLRNPESSASSKRLRI